MRTHNESTLVERVKIQQRRATDRNVQQPERSMALRAPRFGMARMKMKDGRQRLRNGQPS